MSEWMRGARSACDRFAPTLALLDDPASPASAAIAPAERAAALAHLAGCARCQADQAERAADARLDAALRRAFNPRAAAPLATRDLLLAIGATHEPAAHMTAAPASGAASPIRSEFYLKDSEEQEELNGMNNADERDSERATPAHTMATIPNLRPAPRPREQRGRPGSQALAMGFSATAAAVILVVVAATLFASRGRAPANTAHGASATATAQAQLATSANGGAVMVVSMDSPTDGWAIGQPGAAAQLATPYSGGMRPNGGVFYHYTGGKWVQTSAAPTFEAGAGAMVVYLKMVSPTDGWAYDGAGHLLRYDGASWRAAPLSLPGAESVFIQRIDMISPTLGWAAVNVNSGPANSGVIEFARFDGAKWTLEPIVNLPAADARQFVITGISVTPQGDAWAVGSASAVIGATNPPTSGPSGVGLVFHRINGQWVTQAPLNTLTDVAAVNPQDIYMSSATNGWIVGDADQLKTSSEGLGIVSHALLLRFDGQRWTPVKAPLETTTSHDQLMRIVAAGPDDIWVSGESSTSHILSNGVQVGALLLHFDGNAWSQVWPDAPIAGVTSAWMSAYGIDVTADGSLWVVGDTELVQGQQGNIGAIFWRYSNGVWSVTPVTRGK